MQTETVMVLVSFSAAEQKLGRERGGWKTLSVVMRFLLEEVKSRAISPK